MNVMTHGLEKRSPSLPLGIDVQSAYATLSTGSNRVAVVLRNNTRDWIEIGKGTLVTQMVATNQVPQVIDTISADKGKSQPTLTEAERQDLLLDKLDLSGLEAWPAEDAEKAHGLLRDRDAKKCHDPRVEEGPNKITVHSLPPTGRQGSFNLNTTTRISSTKRSWWRTGY